MDFGPVPVSCATGAVLAHSVQTHEGRLRKGLVLDAGHIAQLQAAGVSEVTVARLGADDVAEDAAAKRLAEALVPNPEDVGLRLGPAGTGRCNIFATAPGVAVINEAAINAVNAIDPMITVATVPLHARMAEGVMLATVKIIAYGVAAPHLDRTCAVAKDALAVSPTRCKRVLLIETVLDGQSMPAKGAAPISDRVTTLGGTLDVAPLCAHKADALAERLATAQSDLILILTASATSDIHDTAPQALVQAGGTLIHFGMPVDPGNLLFLGDLRGTPVIGLPGCARSPALNGADWVLERVMCGIDISGRDIMGMGVGGLLKEIPTRPQPRKPVSP